MHKLQICNSINTSVFTVQIVYIFRIYFRQRQAQACVSGTLPTAAMQFGHSACRIKSQLAPPSASGTCNFCTWGAAHQCKCARVASPPLVRLAGDQGWDAKLFIHSRLHRRNRPSQCLLAHRKCTSFKLKVDGAQELEPVPVVLVGRSRLKAAGWPVSP
jgi:hypothetical protein